MATATATQTPELAKQQLSTWITLFYISLPSLHDYDLNVQQTFRQISLFDSGSFNRNDVVKLDRNGNAMFALISKIVSSKAIIGNTLRVPPFETWISQHFDEELYSRQFNTAMLGCVQTDATLLTNNSQHCCVDCMWLLRVLLHVVGCCFVLLRKVWNRSNFSVNNF